MEDITGKAIDTGVQFLRIVSPLYLVISIKLVANGILRGAGLLGRFMAPTFTDLTLIFYRSGPWKNIVEDNVIK